MPKLFSDQLIYLSTICLKLQFDFYRSWMDVWDVLSKDCRDEVVLVDCEDFNDHTLENYLRKHRSVS